MSPTRAAAYLGGAVLFAGWFASAAGVTRQARIARALPPSPEIAQLDAVMSNVQSQASRLRQRMASAPAPQAPFRNPFVFAERQIRPVATARREPALAPLELVPPDEPPLDLLGVAEEGATRTAMIGMGDELLMVTVGHEVAGRYRVAAVGPDVVELKDLATGATRRLALKLPA
jgi:Tfp pilus assembly protein PilP